VSEAIERANHASHTLTACEAITIIAPLADSLALILARCARQPRAGADIKFAARLAEYIARCARDEIPGEAES
jgi:hypothetical protein